MYEIFKTLIKNTFYEKIFQRFKVRETLVMISYKIAHL